MNEVYVNKYEQLMKDNSLIAADLNDEAKTGIDSITQIQKAINLCNKNQKLVQPKVYTKLKALDKWVCAEINDIIKGRNTNTAAPVTPTEVKEIVAEIKTGSPDNTGAAATPNANSSTEPVKTPEPAKTPDDKKQEEVQEVTNADPKGLEADKQLKALFDAGKTSLTLAELKSSAKTAYDFVFDNYTPEGENGLETSHYKLIETGKEVFTLSKI